MTTYLTIITSVLVLTQIIRVTQNYFQLRHIAKVEEHNQLVVDYYEKAIKYFDRMENE